jgi:hypothetical protein
VDGRVFQDQTKAASVLPIGSLTAEYQVLLNLAAWPLSNDLQVCPVIVPKWRHLRIGIQFSTPFLQRGEQDEPRSGSILFESSATHGTFSPQ